MTATSAFFRSRWVDAPAGLSDARGLAKGFRAAGAAAGIKPSGGLDVGLLVCDGPEPVSAARFTRSGTLAAPVIVTKERTQLDGLRAVAVNSGNANAATGRPGLDEAARMQGGAAMATATDEDRVAVCSTGVIGVPLDGRKIMQGLLACSSELSAEGDAAFAAAIMTTDAFEKRCSLDVELASGTVRMSAQAKGAGMMQPNFATMLCFVQTDAALEPETADLLLGVCVKRSFDRITVDGQLSTNDTVILMASGASGVRVEPESDDELRLGEALDAVLRQLALDIVRDGEGSKRVGRVVVRGGNPPGVEAVARAVGNSPLVKAALHGGDPNWGRIVQAVGGTLLDTAPLPVDVAIEGMQVCSAGFLVPHDVEELAQRVQRDEVEYVIGLPGDGHETEVFFSDLSYDYVRINAEYTT
ncbi:MAG: glutamate N-acetyltransferase / amino-acid N-acetyltransferase [Solirubrobacteraceae bacterium]|nr:glutamate N-acetyltransferase / amino-acid N-acetyltransferase [Solirubrobacteraceae bacterium]